MCVSASEGFPGVRKFQAVGGAVKVGGSVKRKLWECKEESKSDSWAGFTLRLNFKGKWSYLVEEGRKGKVSRPRTTFGDPYRIQCLTQADLQ